MKYKSGFTLIEILVVLAIIAIMSSLIVVNLHSNSRSSFLVNTRKVAAVFSLLSDEAVYTDSLLVCKLNYPSITCSSYKSGKWHPFNIKHLVSWRLPKNLQIDKIIVDGVNILPTRKIRFYSSGNQSIMSLHIVSSNYGAWIDGDLHGTFRVHS